MATQPKIDRPKADLNPYPGIVKALNASDLVTELGWSREGWCLDVYQGEELVLRARSKQSVPECFRHLGRQIERALRRRK